MGFRGVTFGGENVNPKNDGGLYQAHHGDGILWGCGMSLDIPNHKLNIMKGELIACGRVIEVDGATEVDLSAMSQDYVRVILNIDLSNLPPYTSLDESASISGFGSLTQGNLNNNDTVYQIRLAIVQQSGGNPASIYSTMAYSQVRYRTTGNTLAHIGSSSTGNPFFECMDGSGNVLGGIICNPSTKHTFYYGNASGNTYIRPNGADNSSNQIYFDTSGQQYGGHPLNAPSTAISDKSLTANTLTELHAFTGLDSSGVYACSGKFAYTPSGTTAHYPEIRIAGSSQTSTTRAQNSFYSASSTAKYMSISTVFTGLSRITLYAHTHSSSVTATASDIRFEIVRLA